MPAVTLAPLGFRYSTRVTLYALSYVMRFVTGFAPAGHSLAVRPSAMSTGLSASSYVTLRDSRRTCETSSDVPGAL